jgi:type II secretory pathway component PulJ
MFLNPRIGRQSGFGLVELMIGLLVGMIVVGAAVSLLSTTMASSNDSIKMTRLDQELRQTMTMLTRDLRRATVWDPAPDVLRVSMSDPLALSGNAGSVTVISTGGNLYKIGDKAIGGILIYAVREVGVSTVYQGTITAYSPSNNGTYSVTLTGTWPADVTKKGIKAGNWNILRPESMLTDSSTCILFASDNDSSGIYENPERFGYRYDATAKAVEIRTSAASTDTCTSGGSWENLTDENTVEITNFSVTDNSPASFASGGLTVDLRQFTISITGRLKSDHSVVRTLQETVRVRNDRLS